MSRFLLLFLVLIWMTWKPQTPAPVVHWPQTAIFFGGYALLVVAMGVWCRALSRKRHAPRLRRFMGVMFSARLAIPLWLALGLYRLRWGYEVRHMLGAVADWPLHLPGVIVATAPALLAWMGLWWSQYPAERGLREQKLLVDFDEGLPIQTALAFWSYFRCNL